MTNEKYGAASLAAPAPRSGVGPLSTVNTTSSPIGCVINGRYKIKRLLGAGGMGGVYEGEHLEIGRRVAIKLVHSLYARDPQIAGRIKQEARSTGAIESENIVQVFDAGEDPELGIFLVMELLKGEDLGALLARRKQVSPMAAATMVIQAAQGLSRAHAAGIIHRDLKPANIFLSTRDDGSSLVKLVDFGIAKLLRDASQASLGASLTRMGMVIGTPQYMSPEQAQGLLTVDHRTDIYSLGAVLFEACVGRSPFLELPTYEQTIVQIITRQAPRISSAVPDVPPELDQLCADMLAHDPNARPRDMTEVRERLARIFPEVEGGRLPMRSLANEVGYEVTLSAISSERVRADIDAAFSRAGLSGVGLAAPRPASDAPSTMPAAQTRPPANDEPVTDVPGVPSRRSSAILAAVGAFALVATIAGVAVLKTRPAQAPAAAPVGYGLVQSTVAASAVVTESNIPPPPPEPVAAAAPIVNDTPVAPEKPKATKVTRSPRAPAPVVAASPASSATEKPEKETPRPVGGTGMSQEF